MERLTTGAASVSRVRSRRVGPIAQSHRRGKPALTGKTGLAPERRLGPSLHGKRTGCVFQNQWRTDLGPRAWVFVRLLSIGSPGGRTITTALRWSNHDGPPLVQ